MNAEADGGGVGPHAGQHNRELRNFHFPRLRFWKRMAAQEDPKKLRELIDQSRARSAVFDVLTHGVPIEIQVDAG